MDYFGFSIFECRYSTLMDSEFVCGESDGQVEMVGAMEPVMAVTISLLLACYISFTREKIQRENFLLLSISECQKRIMHLRQDENQQMLASMLPSQMIDRLKSKEATVVVDSYSEVSVLFAIIGERAKRRTSDRDASPRATRSEATSDNYRR